MDQNSSPNYKGLPAREIEMPRQKEGRPEVEKTGQAEAQTKPLTGRVPSRPTKEEIPLPTEKLCPNRVLPWTDCAAAQQKVYDSVCSYLQATSHNPLQLFPTVLQLKGMAGLDPRLSCDEDLERYEETSVESHVRRIISELGKIPEARQAFALGDGVLFERHSNSLDDDAGWHATLGNEDDLSRGRWLRLDQFCIHRDDNAHSLLMTRIYKPPHKLSPEHLRVGLQPDMNFRNDMAKHKTIPTDKSERLIYNAKQIVGSVLTQAYHVMLWEGVEVSYVTIGVALVLLRIPHDDPDTLLYFLCEPNIEIDRDCGESYREPRSAISRVLCLILMSPLSHIRDQAWRAKAREQVNTWATSLEFVRSKIPNDELQHATHVSQRTGLPYDGTENSNSRGLQSSSPIQLTTQHGYPQHRSECTSSQTVHCLDQPLNKSISNQTVSECNRKRDFSQVTASLHDPSSIRRDPKRQRSSSPQQHPPQYCTQRCFVGLQNNGILDETYPNADLHRQSGNPELHPITTDGLIQDLTQQLNNDLDQHCTPLGHKDGTSGIPFRVFCARYGYTVFGKGTTDRLWKMCPRKQRFIESCEKRKDPRYQFA